MDRLSSETVFGRKFAVPVNRCHQKPSAELLPDKDCISCLLRIALHLAHITSFPSWGLPPDSSYKVIRRATLSSGVLSGFFQLCPGTNFSKPQFPQQNYKMSMIISAWWISLNFLYITYEIRHKVSLKVTYSCHVFYKEIEKSLFALVLSRQFSLCVSLLWRIESFRADHTGSLLPYLDE